MILVFVIGFLLIEALNLRLIRRNTELIAHLEKQIQEIKERT